MQKLLKLESNERENYCFVFFLPNFVPKKEQYFEDLINLFQLKKL